MPQFVQADKNKIMKNIFYITALFFSLFLTSCEEVIDVDLDTAAPRLVIDASINWEKGTLGNEQKIKLTTTTGYYNPTIPVVGGATVFITNSTGTQFTFAETPGTGEYVCTNFFPEVGETYVLTVINDGQTYKATETLYPASEIDTIAQDNEGGFLNEDVEIRFFFQDNPLVDNFYLIRFDSNHIPYPDYDVLDDEFFQGNQMFGIFSDEDLVPGDVVGIKLYGISERYYNYMEILISMAEGGSGGGPFQTPPVSLRGNIVNQNNEANYPLGYFRLGEVSKFDYTVQP